MASILLCEGSGVSRPCSCLLPLAYLTACAWGCASGSATLFCSRSFPVRVACFLSIAGCGGVVPVSSVVLGRTGGPKGPLSVCRVKPENRGRGLCQHFEHVTVPVGEAKRIMEADNAANVSGFSRARAMRVMPGSVLTALDPESLGITDMSVYGKSGKPLAPVVAGTRFDATASAEKRRVSTVSPLMG